MAVRRARIITLVALLGGISALAAFCTPPAAQQAPDELRAQAEQGNVTAQVELGFMYATGDGVPKDFVTAHQWLSLAAVSLEGPGLATVTRYRDVVAQQLSPTQLAEAERRSREWVRTPER